MISHNEPKIWAKDHSQCIHYRYAVIEQKQSCTITIWAGQCKTSTNQETNTSTYLIGKWIFTYCTVVCIVNG